VSTALLGFLVALLVGAITFFTAGERTGIATFVGIVALSFLVTALSPVPVLWSVLIAELAVSAWAGWLVYDNVRGVLTALSTTQGPVAVADAADLAAAQQQLDDAAGQSSFRLELSEDELTAVLQESLAQADQPLRSIAVDIVDGSAPGRGAIDFTGEFKSGDYRVTGTLAVAVSAGAVQVELGSVELGSLRLPGFARGAVAGYIDHLLDSVEQINALLADAQVDVQSIIIGNDRLVVTGVQQGGETLTASSVLDELGALAAAAGPTATPPQEVLGPGVADDTYLDGAVFYVALGDSLAANVGVDSPRQGYVSRVHRQLQLRDGREYGLYDLGVSGETSASLIRGGQLDEAVAFMSTHRVAYVTVDVGANDLLGHLTSADCSQGLDAPACQQRLESALAAYQPNIAAIFDAIHQAAPEAQIIFLEAYNPFSLGTGTTFEEETNTTLGQLNDLGAAAALSKDLLVADGFGPMQGEAAYTTHMLDSPPDIHPNGLGYDVLAQAVVAALG
jgi:lysophospholipase L1-like esterase